MTFATGKGIGVSGPEPAHAPEPEPEPEPERKGDMSSSAVRPLLQRFGLLEHERQLRALGATTPLHLFQLTTEDLAALTDPPVSGPQRRAFEALLAQGQGEGGAEAAGVEEPSEAQLEEALRIEDGLRTGAEGQRRFHEAEQQDDIDWLHVAAELQQTALIQAGVRPTTLNLGRLRDAALRNPALARYVRHNRCRFGELQLGDRTPDIPLLSLDGTRTPLLPPPTPGRPLAILAGSYS